MTPQEFVQDAYNKLKAQGRPSMFVHRDKTISCRYRGHNGVKCGIGMYIPDDKYDRTMEGNLASALIVFETLPQEIQAIGKGWLDSVQAAHDEAAFAHNEDGKPFLEELARKFIAIATVHKLEFTP